MAEAKRCEIHLLDDRKLEMLLQPKFLSADLLDIVVSQFSLREKDYFGIWYLDDMNQKKWLRLEKKVLDHSFKKNVVPVILMFGVRLYIPSFIFLKESTTVELFYLQAIKSIAQGDLTCDFKTMFLLAAYVMQARNGDYISESITYDDFKNMKLLPKTAFAATALNGCLNEIVSHYKRMTGLPRGDAIVNYMNIVERLPMYGIQFFNVKDKNDVSSRLGVSHRGVGLYDLEETFETKEIYTWNRIENLFYRDKKFSLEIRNLSRTGSSNSISSLGRYSTIRNRSGQKLDVVTWSLANSTDCREVWSISVGYHQQYVSSRSPQPDESKRTLKDIARELTRSTSSLALSSDTEISNSNSYNPLPFEKDLNVSVVSQLITALNLRKEFLEKLLGERKKQLKKLSLWESDLTKVCDVEVSWQEDSFHNKNRYDSLVYWLEKDIHQKKANLEKMKKDYEIQQEITEVSKVFAADERLCRMRSKDKQMLHKKAVAKLRLLETKLEDLQSYISKEEEVSNYDAFTENVEHRGYCKSKSYEPRTERNEIVFERDSVQENQFDRFREQNAPDISSTKQPVKGKYLFGEFGNSGVYSSLKAANLSRLDHVAPNLHGSSSLTQISTLYSKNTEQSNNRNVSYDQRQFSNSSYSRMNSESAILHNKHAPRRTSESHPSRQSYNSTYSNQTNDSEFTSVLSGAAWSQLSQPSLESLAQNLYSETVVAHYGDITDKGNICGRIGEMNDVEDFEETTLV